MAMTRSAPSRKALAMANWPTGPQPQTAMVSPAGCRTSRAHVAGGQDVGEEEHLLVRHPVRHFERSHVGKGDPGVLRLAAGVTPGEMRVAEDTRSRVPPQLLGHPGVGIGVLTDRVHPLLAGEADAAGDGEGHHHPIADFQLADTGPTSTTSPMNSWPRMSPGIMAGT